MSDKEKGCQGWSEVRSVGRSFGDAYRIAREQIDERNFPILDRDLVIAVQKVMAEIYMLAPSAVITIDDEKQTAGQCAEIYRQLTREHIIWVIGKYRQVADEIRSVRRYLRTMLYNVVFEYEAAEVNQVSVDLGPLKEMK